MKPRLLLAVAIFVGSYLPLSTILLIQDFDKKKASGNVCLNLMSSTCHIPLQKPVLSIGFVIVCLICFLITRFVLNLIRNDGKDITIISVKHTPADLMNYVLPYIVSFMSVDYMQEEKFIGFILFLTWLFWISFKSGQIILNPVLTILNWNMYEISYNYPGDKKQYEGIVLANCSLEPKENYSCQTIQSVMIIHEES